MRSVLHAQGRPDAPWLVLCRFTLRLVSSIDWTQERWAIGGRNVTLS
jgi:hypothetical protein